MSSVFLDGSAPCDLSAFSSHYLTSTPLSLSVEVNGVNIGNENHKQVVERIKTNPNEAQLLVVDRQTDAYYKEKKIVIKGTLPSVLYLKTPTIAEEEEAERLKGQCAWGICRKGDWVKSPAMNRVGYEGVEMNDRR